VPGGAVGCALATDTYLKGSKEMNKSQLIEAVADDTGLTKTDTALVVESLLGTVSKTLKKGDEVIITGFGKFSVAKRAARNGVNPRTGERVKIKASKAPKFSAGATLKQAVSGKKK
jgi:DNA-binding protein HU-beta